LIGVKSSINIAFRQVTEHIKENIVETRKIKLDADFAHFLNEFRDHVQAKHYLASVKWELNLNGESEISMEGKCLDVGKGTISKRVWF